MIQNVHKAAEHPIRRKLRENRLRMRQMDLPIVNQRQLAQALDVDPAQLTRWMKGQYAMPEWAIEAAAKALGCEVSDITSSEPEGVAA